MNQPAKLYSSLQPLDQTHSRSSVTLWGIKELLAILTGPKRTTEILWEYSPFPFACVALTQHTKCKSLAYILGLVIWVALCSLLINRLVMYRCLFVCLWTCHESLTSPGKLGGTLIIEAWRASSWPHRVPLLSLLRLMGSWHMTKQWPSLIYTEAGHFPTF